MGGRREACVHTSTPVPPWADITMGHGAEGCEVPLPPTQCPRVQTAPVQGTRWHTLLAGLGSGGRQRAASPQEQRRCVPTSVPISVPMSMPMSVPMVEPMVEPMVVPMSVHMSVPMSVPMSVAMVEPMVVPMRVHVCP